MVTVESMTRTSDGMGGWTEEWSILATVRAAIWPKKMVEQVETGKRTATVTHQIRVRYLDGIDEECRVVFGDRIFEVISVLNVEERNRTLDLMCEEAK
jgi:SPP1 family predicted phage head-tail adaptor